MCGWIGKGIFHPSLAERLVGELCMCLRMNSPATSRVANGGCPGPTRHTELKRPRQPHQRMAKVDDLLERRAKQVALAIVARLAHRSPRQRISPSKESRTAQIGNPKPQENPHAHPAFLQTRLPAQVKSSRSINRFRILHGRLHSTPHKCPMRTLAWEGRGGATRLAISGAREHGNRKPTRARLACPRKIHHPECPSGSNFVLDCANDRREYGAASASGDHL